MRELDLRAKSVAYMLDRCDKCQNMARVTVSGAIVPAYLCASHARDLCVSVGDTAGVDKFTALMDGDRQLAL